MDITRETQEQSEQRLRSVLQAADIAWLPGHFAFTETAIPDDAVSASHKALAIVRDKSSWSVLAEAEEETSQKFRIFSCHFDEDIPNSGFVGWLASKIKRELGSGVFVVCGHNRQRGGIFDYWGVPAEIAPSVLQLIEKLRIPASL
jgi:hypothetical protein